MGIDKNIRYRMIEIDAEPLVFFKSTIQHDKNALRLG